MSFGQKLRIRKSHFSLLSGLVFVAVFWIGYRSIPDRYYKNRDDALITFSAARNLVEHGVVGVNSSGGRVEAYSTPAQFLLFYAFYAAARVPYETFAQWQTFVCAFLLGFFFIKFFRADYLWGLIFSFVSAVLCLHDPSFLEWHGSGMENPIVHVLFLVSIYLLYKMFLERRISYGSAFFLFAASIARIESIYYIGPLLLIFAFIWRREEKNLEGAKLAAVVFGL